MSKFTGATVLGALLLSAATGGSAFAHATLEVGEAPAGSTYRAVLRIPHGCDGQATHTVRVELPEGFFAAKPMPKPGWELSLETGPYARTYDNHGEPMAEGLRVITWSGGDLPDAWYDEFVFRGTIADLPAGTVLAFKTTQLCADGAVAWVEIPADGQDPHALDFPAPLLRVGAPSGDGHGGHGGHGEAAAVTLGDLTIDTVFARATVGRSGAAYLVVTNAGDTADRLLAAASPVAAKVELHNMTVVDDVMQMAEVEGGIEVPAHGAVALAPGGLHVMMMGLEGPLVEGGSFPVTLTFEQAGEVTLDVPVLGAAAAGADDHSGH